jgi:hypothetical protein
MQPTVRFWMLAVIEDLTQDAGVVPIPSAKKPLLTFQQAVEILGYDPVLLPAVEKIADIYCHTSLAATTIKWPSPQENDFITIVGWRYMQAICEMEDVVSIIFFLIEPDYLVHDFRNTPRLGSQEYTQTLEDVFEDGFDCPEAVKDIWLMHPAYATDTPAADYDLYQKKPYSHATLQGHSDVAKPAPPLIGHNRKWVMTGRDSNVGHNKVSTINLNISYLDSIVKKLSDWLVTNGLMTIRPNMIVPRSLMHQVSTLPA